MILKKDLTSKADIYLGKLTIMQIALYCINKFKGTKIIIIRMVMKMYDGQDHIVRL